LLLLKFLQLIVRRLISPEAQLLSMEKSTQSVLLYVAPFLFYLFLPALLNLAFNQYVAYPARTVLMSILLLFLIPRYKLSLRKVSVWAVPFGVAIIVIWILIDPYYPHLGVSEYNPFLTEGLVYLQFLVKFVGLVFVAAFVEELFVRAFLNRLLVNPFNWETVPQGKFTTLSFAVTTIFFGFAHYRWLAGLVAGALFNLTYQKTRSIESCILAHAIANGILFVYAVFTNSWALW